MGGYLKVKIYKGKPFFFLSLLTVFIFFTGNNAFSKSHPFREPWEKIKNQNSPAIQLTDCSDRGFLTGSFLTAITFFQIFISPADGDRCPMHPSCSRYAQEAVRKYGIVKGAVLAADRLLRCGRETDYPLVFHQGHTYYFDPLY